MKHPFSRVENEKVQTQTWPAQNQSTEIQKQIRRSCSLLDTATVDGVANPVVPAFSGFTRVAKTEASSATFRGGSGDCSRCRRSEPAIVAECTTERSPRYTAKSQGWSEHRCLFAQAERWPSSDRVTPRTGSTRLRSCGRLFWADGTVLAVNIRSVVESLGSMGSVAASSCRHAACCRGTFRSVVSPSSREARTMPHITGRFVFFESQSCGKSGCGTRRSPSRCCPCWRSNHGRRIRPQTLRTGRPLVGLSSMESRECA